MARNTASNNGADAKAPGPFVVLAPVDPSTVTRTAAEGETPSDRPLFEIVGEYVGKTSKQAIGKAVGENGGGTYVAIPKRSFNPRAVESVGVPRLKWS